MPGGPVPKPTPLKILAGNPGKRRIHGEPIPPPADLTPPTWLKGDKRALAIWAEEAPRLIRMGCLGDVDRIAFSCFCERVATYQRAARKIRRRMVQMVGAMEQPLAQVSIARGALNGLLQLASRFGMTPSDRARITSIGTGENNGASKWATLVRK